MDLEDLKLERQLASDKAAVCRRHGEAQAADHYDALVRALDAELARLDQSA